MKNETIILENYTRSDPWEGCVNGTIYRIERGVPVEVPDFLAELIRSCERERTLSEARMSAYTSPTGARIG